MKCPSFLFEVGNDLVHHLFDLVWVLAINRVHHRPARIRKGLTHTILRNGLGLLDEEAVIVYPTENDAIFIEDIFAHHLAIGDATYLTEKVKDI